MTKLYKRRSVLGYLGNAGVLSALHIPPTLASPIFPEKNFRIAGNISIGGDTWYVKGRLYFHLTSQGYSCGIEIRENPDAKPVYEMHTKGIITDSGLAPLRTVSTKRIDHWIFLGNFFPLPLPAYKHETITLDYILVDGKISRINVERVKEGRNQGIPPKGKERDHDRNNFEGLDYISSVFFLLSLLRDGQTPEELTTISEWGQKEVNQVIIKQRSGYFKGLTVFIRDPETSLDRLELIVNEDANLEHVRLNNKFGDLDMSHY